MLTVTLCDWSGSRLPVDGEPMARLAADGFRPGVLQTKRFPDLGGDVPTVDFSGWQI